MTTDAIVRMRKYGHPVGIIAARFKMTAFEVYWVLKSAGLAEDWMATLYVGEPPKPRYHPAFIGITAGMARRAAMIDAYHCGASPAKIAATFNVERNTIYAVLKRAGVPTRKAIAQAEVAL